MCAPIPTVLWEVETGDSNQEIAPTDMPIGVGRLFCVLATAPNNHAETYY